MSDLLDVVRQHRYRERVDVLQPGEYTVHDVAEALGVGTESARKLLVRLIESGKVSRRKVANLYAYRSVDETT